MRRSTIPADPALPPPIYPHGARLSAAGVRGIQPYDPYRPVKPPGTNGKAIAALVCALAGLVFCGLARRSSGSSSASSRCAKRRRTGQDGYGLALAGTIIGGLVDRAGSCSTSRLSSSASPQRMAVGAIASG